jgi:hypothetical protein
MERRQIRREAYHSRQENTTEYCQQWNRKSLFLAGDAYHVLGHSAATTSLWHRHRIAQSARTHLTVRVAASKILDATAPKSRPVLSRFSAI